MCNIEEKIEEEITEIEKDFIEAKKQYTALDVGNELKRKGYNVRQRFVSPVVREHFDDGEIYENSGYTRVLIPVKNGKEAFLYTPAQYDPADYNATHQDPLPWDPSAGLQKKEKKIVGVISIAFVQSQPSYKGSSKSDVAHSAGCSYAKRIKKGNEVSFDDLSDAETNNYRMCRRE